jgi:hypothetical protein
LACLLALLVSPVNGASVISTFQEGSNGYSGTRDAELADGAPDENRGQWDRVAVDYADKPPPPPVGRNDGLLWFSGIFGYGGNQIRPGAQILQATLTLESLGPGTVHWAVHRMLMTWDEDQVTWAKSFGGDGVTRGTDCLADSDYDQAGAPVGTVVIGGVAFTAGVQAWANGESNNYGWALLATSEDFDGWAFASSEHATLAVRPKLTVEWISERRVPEDYPCIQAAIDDSVDGNVIVVADGVYTGAGCNTNLDFGGRAITVRSRNGARNCVIDCEYTGRGFIFQTGEGSLSVVEGFTILHGVSATDGAAIRCISGSSPLIANCRIEENHSPLDGGAIGCQGSSPTIINCLIMNNSAADTGGGVYCAGGSNPLILNCTIVWNQAGNLAGGIDSAGNSHPVVVNCIVWGNTPDAIVMRDGGAVDVRYSCVQGGWAGEGNISLDPRVLPTNGRLLANSPCIDAGDTTAMPADLYVDLARLGRRLDHPPTPDTGVPAGLYPPVIIDMGAYEFQPLPGDVNCDGVTDFDDINPFVRCLVDPGACWWW